MLTTTTTTRHLSSSSSYLPPLVRPVHYRSVNVASSPSANVRWASSDAVNFMDHLYFITNVVLDYLLENDLPQELMNRTLFDDPISVLSEHKNELITHFHKLLITACTCLCIGISIPLFGFMLACCWCSSGTKSSSASKRAITSSSGGHHSSRSSNTRPNSRSRSNQYRESSDTDWLALAGRDSSSSNHGGGGRGHSGSRSTAQYNNDRRRRHGGRGQRSRHSNNIAHTSSANYTRSRSVPPSLKYESTCHPCLRTFFSSNLFIILLLISFFAVCAFVTNEYANNGVKQLPKAFNQSIDELQVYLNNTDYEVDNLLRVNYNQLESEINLRLDTAGMIIKQKLAISSEAIALVNLTDIVTEFNDTKIRLEKLDRELSGLKSRLLTAKISLSDLRRKLESCPPDQCQLLRKKYQHLDNFKILPQYEKLPDVKHLIKKVTQLIDSGIVAQVQRGKDDFDRYGTYIQREVNGTTPEIKIQLAVVGKRLSGLASDFSRSSRSTNEFFKSTKSSAKILSQYTEYEQYRRYACLAGASVILFILLCYILGWLFGSCRPQPTSRTYKTRVKTSASASFPFSCGIVTVFLLFLPMILAAIVLFMTGSIGDKIVCRVIKHPEQKQSKQIYAMLQNKFFDTSLPIDATDQDYVIIRKNNEGKELHIYRPNFADLVTRCHRNQSIFKVLKLDKYDQLYFAQNSIIEASSFNSMTEFKKVNNIEAKLKVLIKDLDLDTSRITLLSAEAEEILKKSIGLSFDDIENSFSRLSDIGTNISPIDIEQLIKDMNVQKTNIQGPNQENIDAELSSALILASGFNEQLLPNITNSLLNLKDGIRHLKLRMFHGKNNFGSVVIELISKLRSAEKQIREEGKTLIKNAANEFIDELNILIDQYTSHVKNQVENVIGQCDPVSRALNSTTSTLCDDIILPFNGYWLSITASLILILPATFLAYALKGLYQLAKRGGGITQHHGYSYTDQEDEISYEDDCEEIALAYHLGNHNVHHLSNKPSNSSAMPSAPAAVDDGWSPTSPSYIHNSRPPPYAV